MTKRALVLSGGASKGAWQLGALKKIMGEDKKDYEIITGVSVGALNAAALSQFELGKPEDAINWTIDFWQNNVLKTSDIYKRWFPFGRVHSLWSKSLYDSKTLHKLFKNNFDKELVLKSGREIAVGAVNMDTGEVVYVRESDPNFEDFVLASSSFPVFLTPIIINGKMYSDGGVKEVTPLSQAIRMGATEIDVLISTRGLFQNDQWSSKSKNAVPDQIVRVANLMHKKIMQLDIQVTGLKNNLADLGANYRNVKVRVLTPSRELTDDSLRFSSEDTKRMIDIGYNDALNDNFVIYD